MRIRLSKNELDLLFKSIKQQILTWKNLAKMLKISIRNLNDWRKGKILLPEETYLQCLKLGKNSPQDFHPSIYKERWHILDAARKGGTARMKIYGSLGTVEGRKKGGFASIKTHLLNNKGFKILKSINKPKLSDSLAELIGILVGDGHLSDYQIGITTNSLTDKKHAEFIKKLINNLFRVEATISKKKNENTLDIRVSSKNLVEFMNFLGMPKGNKIKNNLAVPEWIKGSKQYKKAFLRGLFDTDGCIYLDKHLIKGKFYLYMGWTITSYADKLIEGIIEILKDLGFNPTYRVSQKSVYLRKQEEIKKYFKEIGTHNNKHQERYLKFCGEVPKWS